MNPLNRCDLNNNNLPIDKTNSIKIILTNVIHYTRLLTSEQQAAWQHSFDMGIVCVCLCECPIEKWSQLQTALLKKKIDNHEQCSIYVLLLFVWTFFSDSMDCFYCLRQFCLLDFKLLGRRFNSQLIFFVSSWSLCALHNNKLKWFEDISMKQKGACNRVRERERCAIGRRKKIKSQLRFMIIWRQIAIFLKS